MGFISDFIEFDQKFMDHVTGKEDTGFWEWKKHMILHPFQTFAKGADFLTEKENIDKMVKIGKDAATQVGALGELVQFIQGVTNSPHWWVLPGGDMARPPVANEQRPAGPNQLAPIQAVYDGGDDTSKVSNAQSAGIGHMSCLNVALSDIYDNVSFDLLMNRYYEGIRLYLRSNLPYSVTELKDYFVREMSLYARLLALVRRLQFRMFIDPTVPEFQRVWKRNPNSYTEKGLVDTTAIPLLSEEEIADAISMYPILQQTVAQTIALPKYSELVAWLTARVYADQNATNRQYYWVHLVEVPVYTERGKAATGFVDAEIDVTVRGLINEYRALHTEFGMLRADLIKVGLAAQLVLPDIAKPTAALVHDPEFFSFLENSYCMSPNLYKMVANYSKPEYVRVDYLPSCYGDVSQMNGTSLGLSNFVEGSPYAKPIIRLVSQTFFLSTGGTFVPHNISGSIAAGDTAVARELVEDREAISAFNMTSWMQQRTVIDDVEGSLRETTIDTPYVLPYGMDGEDTVTVQFSYTNGAHPQAFGVTDTEPLLSRFPDAAERLRGKSCVYLANYNWRQRGNEYWGTILWVTDSSNLAVNTGTHITGEIIFMSNIPGYDKSGYLSSVGATVIMPYGFVPNVKAIVRLDDYSWTWSAQKLQSGLVGTIFAPPAALGYALKSVDVTGTLAYNIRVGLGGLGIDYQPYGPMVAWLTTMFDYSIPVYLGAYLKTWPGTYSGQPVSIDSYAYLAKTAHVTAWTNFTEISTAAEMQQIALFSETTSGKGGSNRSDKSRGKGGRGRRRSKPRNKR